MDRGLKITDIRENGVSFFFSLRFRGVYVCMCVLCVCAVGEWSKRRDESKKRGEGN